MRGEVPERRYPISSRRAIRIALTPEGGIVKRLMRYVILLAAMAVLVFAAIAAAQSVPEGQNPSQPTSTDVHTTNEQNSTTVPAKETPTETTTAAPNSTTTRGTLPILDGTFDPVQLSIASGTTLKIVNNGTNAHTATADNGLFDTGVLKPGEYFEVYLEGSGTVSYHDKLYPEMKGSITVGEGGVKDPTLQKQQAAEAAPEAAPNVPNIEAAKPSRGY
jgi:plastocyanin